MDKNFHHPPRGCWARLTIWHRRVPDGSWCEKSKTWSRVTSIIFVCTSKPGKIFPNPPQILVWSLDLSLYLGGKKEHILKPPNTNVAPFFFFSVEQAGLTHVEGVFHRQKDGCTNAVFFPSQHGNWSLRFWESFVNRWRGWKWYYIDIHDV